MPCYGIGVSSNPFILLALWLLLTISYALEREFWSFKHGSDFHECDPKHLHPQAGWIKMWLLGVISLCCIFFVTALNWYASPGQDGLQRIRVGIMSCAMLLVAVAGSGLTNDILKKLVRRPRPSFFFQCNYKGYRFAYEEGEFAKNAWMNEFCPTYPDGSPMERELVNEKYCLDGFETTYAWRSMPSGHANLSFVVFTYIALECNRLFPLMFPRAFGRNAAGNIAMFFLIIFIFTIPVLISWTRVINHKHFWTDILAGGIEGYLWALIGHLVVHGVWCMPAVRAHNAPPKKQMNIQGVAYGHSKKIMLNDEENALLDAALRDQQMQDQEDGQYIHHQEDFEHDHLSPAHQGRQYTTDDRISMGLGAVMHQHQGGVSYNDQEELQFNPQSDPEHFEAV